MQFREGYVPPKFTVDDVKAFLRALYRLRGDDGDLRRAIEEMDEKADDLPPG